MSASVVREDVVGAGIARVLEVVLDAVERRARLRVLHFEARDDERACPVPGEDEGDRPLRRHEGEARVVEDVRRVEEHDTRQAGRLRPFEERIAARAVLLGRDRDRREHRPEPMRGLDPTAGGATFRA